jgi:serine/threonine protein phosphatase PrpC
MLIPPVHWKKARLYSADDFRGLMKIRYAGKTDVGRKRTKNEDYFSLIEEDQMFIVADGMGGHASGEVASRMAADTLREFFRHTRADEDATWPYKMHRQLSYLENRLVCAIKLANLRIFDCANHEPQCKGMGTTVAASLVYGDKIYIAHVGDSRVYRLRDRDIQLLTRDHSLLEDYRAAKPDVTAEEVQSFPHKNVITRALGMRESVDVAIQEHWIRAGDIYLLCTDGLSGMVDAEDIRNIVVDAADLERAVGELVEVANANGGVDNVTALLFECLAQ